jgi:hypothetical protein
VRTSPSFKGYQFFSAILANYNRQTDPAKQSSAFGAFRSLLQLAFHRPALGFASNTKGFPAPPLSVRFLLSFRIVFLSRRDVFAITMARDIAAGTCPKSRLYLL